MIVAWIHAIALASLASASESFNACNSVAFPRIRGGSERPLTESTEIGLRVGGISQGSSTLPSARAKLTSIAAGDDVVEAPGKDIYYLLWSQGFLKRFVLSIAALVGMRAITQANHGGFCIHELSASLTSPFVQNGILPLLSSACCLIQIFINVVAGGCAGFNTYLGPLRPYFLAVLAFLSVATKPSFSATIARAVVAMSPELLALWNSSARKWWRRRSRSKAARHEQDVPLRKATIEVNVPTMGCVACINKIDASIRNSAPDAIEHAESRLTPPKGGQTVVMVEVRDDDELNDIAQKVVESITKSGFDGSCVTKAAFEAKSLG